MKNETDDQTSSNADDLKKRLVGHLSDLKEFAQMPEDFRQEVLEEIRDQTKAESENAFLFQTGIELFRRLAMVHSAPGICEDNENREDQSVSPNDSPPQKIIENHIAEDLKLNGTQISEKGFFLHARSAVFMAFGTNGRFNNRSILSFETEGGTIMVKFPFDLGEQIVLRGYGAVMKGRHRSETDEEYLIRFLKESNFDTEIADFTVKEGYRHEGFLFYAVGSLNDLTNALDEITLSDDIIETGED